MTASRNELLTVSAGRIATLLLLPFLFTYAYARNVAPVLAGPQLPLIPQPAGSEGGYEHNFRLRHIFHHGGRQFPQLARRLDIAPDAELLMMSDDDISPSRAPKTYRLRFQSTYIQRLADRRRERMHYLLDAGRERGQPLDLAASEWTTDEVNGPNVTDHQTVLDMARIAANAYAENNKSSEWYDIGDRFHYANDFGWESDGLRGHIFVDDLNRTAIVSIKGTSLGLFDGIGSVHRDKENDNLFFSCCCGQGGESILYHAVCDCQTASYTCNSTCLTQNLRKKHQYYYSALDLYQNVTELYPKAEVWMVGHSLGGSVSSLVGLTYGRPVVTFEAPGEAMAAKRLGLPVPPGFRVGDEEPQYGTGAYHFGHTADPLFLGTCNGYPCSWWGYAMQSVCHTGFECVYNTTRDKNWTPALQYHKIITVIEDVIKFYDTPAQCKPVRDCIDCYKWKYKESNRSDTTTTKLSTTRFTQTRTETCKTPGWWGCLDEPSTATPTPTSTCHTPGWFGCKDPVTSTAVITTDSTSTTSKTTCKSPGWFGCNDPTTTSQDQASSTFPKHEIGQSPSPPTSALPTSTSSCARPGLFWGCKDKAEPGSSPRLATAEATLRR
ncbi:hypothetical protein FH972_021915 [Carpinus fangiana]|uniref:triacylglycerol lipase n=1 Tax=Carpinus fangiana TaxID=176857 RepID=A0A5N6KQQ0_9ROSI|nr:hypothetical protein FH972_021915 [Carpinus fangiana]